MKPTTRTARFRRPEIEHKPTLPPGANCGGCPHLRQLHRHRRPPVLACCWRQSPGKWCLGRLDRMTGCPLAENAQERPVDGAMGKGRLPPAPEGKRPWRAWVLPGKEGFTGTLAPDRIARKIFRKTRKNRNLFVAFQRHPDRPGGPAPAGGAADRGAPAGSAAGWKTENGRYTVTVSLPG